MKRLVCFLMVGLAFTVLQVSTVGAQMGDPNMPPPMGDPNMAPPTGASGMPPMGAPVLTIDDPKCDGSDGPPRTDCPNYGPPPATGGPPPMTGGMPPTTGGMPPGAPHMPPMTGGMPPTTGGPPPMTGGMPPMTGGMHTSITKNSAGNILRARRS